METWFRSLFHRRSKPFAWLICRGYLKVPEKPDSNSLHWKRPLGRSIWRWVRCFAARCCDLGWTITFCNLQLITSFMTTGLQAFSHTSCPSFTKLSRQAPNHHYPAWFSNTVTMYDGYKNNSRETLYDISYLTGKSS